MYYFLMGTNAFRLVIFIRICTAQAIKTWIRTQFRYGGTLGLCVMMSGEGVVHCILKQLNAWLSSKMDPYYHKIFLNITHSKKK